MIARTQTGHVLPRDELERLVTQYGPARIAAALLVAILRHQRARRMVLDAQALNPHLRRDIGLPPDVPRSRPRSDYLRHL